MQKVVIDTNILVSSLIQKSYPYRIVYDLFFDNKLKLCISDKLFQEYYEVLNRKKFAKYPDFVVNGKLLLADIEMKAIKYFPKTSLTIINDVDDNKLLELAFECKADFLITGNMNDFTMPEFKHTKIVTPAEYWEKYRTK